MIATSPKATQYVLIIGMGRGVVEYQLVVGRRLKQPLRKDGRHGIRLALVAKLSDCAAPTNKVRICCQAIHVSGPNCGTGRDINSLHLDQRAGGKSDVVAGTGRSDERRGD